MDITFVDSINNITFGLTQPKFDFTAGSLGNIVFNVSAGIGVGTFDHALLIHRDFPDQHPMDSITNLMHEMEFHTHYSAAILDFESAVINNVAVSANTESRHNQIHVWNGSNHSGMPSTFPPNPHTHTHASTTGQTENDHHNRIHALDSVNHTGLLPHTKLSDVLPDQHHDKIHNADHNSGGVDDISGVYWDRDKLTEGSAAGGERQVPVWEDANKRFVTTNIAASLTLIDTVPTYADLPAGPHPHGYAWITADTQDTWMWSTETVPDAFVNLGPIFSTNHDALTNVTSDQHHAKSHLHNNLDGSGTVAHVDVTGKTIDDHHNKSHIHDGVDGSGTVAHADVTGVGADDHHAQVHAINGADHTGSLSHSALADTSAVDCHPTSAITGLDTVLLHKLDDSVAKFVPQVTPAVPVEGDVFYDSAKKTLSVITDVDMTLNLGQEEVIRVLNISGADIPNATPVYCNGASGGLPTVALAQANLYSTASVPGVTTHLIANGAEGLITHAGTLGGDFSAFNVTDKLWLSSTVAGGMVTTASDIATTVGMVIDNSVDGKMVVKIASLIQLPNVIGYMTGGQVPATIVATPLVITNYATSGKVVSSVNPVTGEINTPSTGTYRVNINVSLAIAPQNTTKTVTLELIDESNVTTTINVTTLTKNAESYSVTVSTPFDAVSGKVYRIQISTDDDIDVDTVNSMSFDLESINIR